MFLPPAVQPIAHLLSDPSISEIMINGVQTLFVERGGKMEEFAPVFTTQRALEAMIEGLLGPTGRNVNALSPFVDFRLADGSRVNVVIPPIALGGPFVTIRKHAKILGGLGDLVRLGTLSEPMARFLGIALQARLNVVFSGGAGAGKTTLVAMLAKSLPAHERIVVIEDTAELELAQRHVVRLECRPPNIEGSGAIDQSQLLRNSLRMRPHRIIVGEVRGAEAVEMLQAMSSGHDGCLAVLHASSPRHAVARMEMMVLSRGLSLPLWGIQRQIASAVDLVVQLAQHEDGSRKVTHITEVGAATDRGVDLSDLFRYQPGEGDSKGALVATGHRPAFLDRMVRAAGESLDHLFAS